MSDFTKYSKTRLNDRQVTELIGIARGLTADGRLNDEEVEYLHKWLVANEGLTGNSMVTQLVARIEDAIADGVIDDDERTEIFEALIAMTGSDFELGEALKSSTLPLCAPAPIVVIPEARFTFTGAFVFGTRKLCEEAVTERGGTSGSLRKDTAFLVIGEYASDDWIHSSYGRKIEKAVSMRDQGVPIRIVAETHWRSFLE